MIYPLGSTNQSLDIRIVNDSGIELTGLVAATITSLTWSLAGSNADNLFGALVDLASLTSAFTANGVKERGNGVYRLDVSNAVFANPGYITIRGSASGQHVLVPPIEVVANTGLGNGVNTVTLTVTDTNSVPLQSAWVTFGSGPALYSGATNASGQITFNVNSATWAVAIYKQGYSFAGANLVVSGNTTQTYSMSTVSITPSNPGFTTGYATCYDQNGNILAGVTITAAMVQAGAADTGHVYDTVIATELSNASGLVQFSNLVLGATYQFTRGTKGTPFNLTIPTTAGSTFALPSFVGNP